MPAKHPLAGFVEARMAPPADDLRRGLTPSPAKEGGTAGI